MNDTSLPAASHWVGNRENAFLFHAFTATCVLFGLGLVLPMMTLTRFFVLENTVSVLSAIFTLLSSGNWILFLAIFGFSIVMPLVKLLLIYILIKAKGRIDTTTKRWLKLMHDYGRWSMLDVFVVAVLLVAVKLGALANVEVHLGLYCFGAAVLAMMVLTHRLAKIYEPIEEFIESQGDSHKGAGR
ncbi:MAG: paraquat-inducible protein A [Chromatiaceae bacterium]